MRPAQIGHQASTFDRMPDGLRLQVPASSRPRNKEPGRTFSLVGEFEFHETRGETDTYRVVLPVLPSLMPTKLKGTHHFGSGAPPGFEVHGPDDRLPFERNGRRAGTYGFDRDHLYVGVRKGVTAPRAADYFIEYPRAIELERARNRATFEGDDAAFALRGETIDTVSVRGLYLPAPGIAEWRVVVPAHGVLSFRGTVLPPAIRHRHTSDGAEIRVEVAGAMGENGTLAGEAALEVGVWSPQRFDLSPWAGQEVVVRFRTVPGENALFDYVFLEGPALFTPSERPRRMLVIFVDTLRPDHLGMYGYDGGTSPTLDRWAQHAAIFDTARAVAPWTLPSARAALSGAQPELWGDVAPLSERLAEAGWHTEALVSNAFLSQPFDMHRGWTRFEYTHLQPASEIVDHAEEVLAEHADRDVLLLVHFMEPHLPYDESWLYRWRFAGLRPLGLESLTRHWLFELPPDSPELPAIRDHVVDRYDANIRVVDDQLLSLFEAVGPDATTVLFSDHGEEFWDHGSFEHGHSFYDELLHVPLVIRSPGMPAGRHDAPVSLLDVTPTLLDLAGLPSEVRHGASLLPLVWGDDGALDALRERPVAFGRPLYGRDGWGVVAADHKWFGRGGERVLFDLVKDAGETQNLADAESHAIYPAAMSESLGTPVVLAWRVKLFSRPSTRDVEVTASLPRGFEHVWSSYDPRGRAAASVPEILEDGSVRLVRPRGSEMPAAIYLVPEATDPLNCAGLEITIRDGRSLDLAGTCRGGVRRLKAEKVDMLAIGDNRWGATVDLEWVPIPQGVAVSGYSSELEDQLRELGYVDE